MSSVKIQTNGRQRRDGGRPARERAGLRDERVGRPPKKRLLERRDEAAAEEEPTDRVARMPGSDQGADRREAQEERREYAVDDRRTDAVRRLGASVEGKEDQSGRCEDHSRHPEGPGEPAAAHGHPRASPAAIWLS